VTTDEHTAHVEALRCDFAERAEARDESLRAAVEAVTQGPPKSAEEVAVLRARLERLQRQRQTPAPDVDGMLDLDALD
jgi:hypothetical protein